MAETSLRIPEPPRPQPTGRFLVLFRPDADAGTIARTIERATGAKTRDSREFGTVSEAAAAVSQGDAVMIGRLGVAAIEPRDAGVGMAALRTGEGVREVRPEFYMFAIADLRERYATWVRDGLQLLAEGATTAFETARAAIGETIAGAAPYTDTDEVTWGLAATGAHRSRFSGRGIKVAVLDTGLDLDHPDFVGRSIVTRSFVPGEDVQDVQGHGTHTAGTIAGPRRSTLGRRYGVAPDVELHVGKVLNNGGSGRELDILQGMDWAIEQGCAVISMSLGRATGPGETPDPLYEEAGAVALREGSLIVAAAGNESRRDIGHIAPVGAPAYARSIVAVAAVDPQMQVAYFSCGGLSDGGGEINLSGPGVAVYSASPRPRLTRVLDGTSMACPHAAGIAALWAESDASLRGSRLKDALERSARSLGIARDFGRGLVRAPDVSAEA